MSNEIIKNIVVMCIVLSMWVNTVIGVFCYCRLNRCCYITGRKMRRRLKATTIWLLIVALIQGSAAILIKGM